MSQQEPDGPYVYQPHPVSRKDGKLWHVGAMPDGLTREQATAIVAILRGVAPAPPAAPLHAALPSDAVVPEELRDALIGAYWKANDIWSSQCFCFTSMPEPSRREAHTVARDGCNELAAMLGVIVRPWLDEEYWAAVRAAKAEKDAPAVPSSPTPEQKPSECCCREHGHGFCLQCRVHGRPAPTPEASTKEPCKVHVDAFPQRPGEQFQRCKVCGIEVGPSGADGGSWVAIDRATYGKVTTWKNGVLQKPTPEAGAE